MSLPSIFRPLARGEFDDAADRYEEEQAGLGHRFTVAVEQVLDQITQHPFRYPIADGDLREAIVPNFPFCVYYRIRSDRVIVVAVYHNSRDPSGWQSRK